MANSPKPRAMLYQEAELALVHWHPSSFVSSASRFLHMRYTHWEWHLCIDRFCHSFPARAATFRLRGFKLVNEVCSCAHTTGCEAYSFATDAYGIFNVRTNWGACRTHKGGWGGGGGGESRTNKSALELTLRHINAVPYSVLPGYRIQSLRRSYHWATSLVEFCLFLLLDGGVDNGSNKSISGRAAQWTEIKVKIMFGSTLTIHFPV